MKIDSYVSPEVFKTQGVFIVLPRWKRVLKRLLKIIINFIKYFRELCRHC